MTGSEGLLGSFISNPTLMTQELNTDPSEWLDHPASAGIGVEGNVSGLGREALGRNPKSFKLHKLAVPGLKLMCPLSSHPFGTVSKP